MSRLKTNPWFAIRFVLNLLTGIFLLAPMVIVVIISFSSARYLTFPPPGFSLQWYQRLVSDPAWLNSLATSLLIMIASAVLATTLGTSAAVGISRSEFRGKKLLVGVLLAPLVVPIIITATAVYSFFVRIGISGTYSAIILAHTVLTIPYVLTAVLASLQMVDRTLERAAMTLGAAGWTAFRRVTLPLILPGVLSGFLFALVISFDELIVAIFLSSPTVRPVTVKMWSDLLGDTDPTISAVGTILFVISVLALAVESLLHRGEGAADRVGFVNTSQIKER